ncbi:type II secretion system minor pseudopilin GspJ [Ectothiorhodospira lacustris]|uniref:type II secretion system minor pseudopilin GspJ n=1 Tax=Ectothiorhodospira lacustris TaxID=2899127 RepID=UPI001EE7EFBD|nr:type II secretion system minor pseudopilin GspJ [Ectothiorhodospira lacustris]MCG5509044.1 type II secretion system minor pseudopilin GspJ [Ectothiorhodospira lacustris]MCG5520835.1 type II secretion system minor pseudopilin GspJ [Ectothiorhodospira lacustris]
MSLRRPPSARYGRGFTLLELIVSLAVFALVSVMAYGGLRAVLEVRAFTDESAARLAEVQMAMTLLGRDLEQVARRPARDGLGEFQPPIRHDGLQVPPRLEVIRAGVRGGAGRSSLQRVAWEVEEGSLYRLYWSALDGGGDLPIGRMPVILRREGFGLRDWELRFHHRDGIEGLTTVAFWPPLGREQQDMALPLAVEIILDLEGIGRVSRLFPVTHSARDH